jgi:hypothetical protein
MPPHRDKLARVGALKAVDRLLGVADREDRANALAPALAGEELLGQCRDDLPLLRISVLRLVDQDVVEPAIELEQNPGGNPRPPQQFERLQHQIVEIEQAVQAFPVGIGAQHRIAEPDQCQRRLDQHGAGPLVDESHDPLSLGFEHGARVAAARPVIGTLGDQDLPDRPLARQQRVDMRVQQLAAAVRHGAPARDHSPAFLIGPRAFGERRRGGAQRSLVARPGRAERLGQAVRGGALGKRKCRGQSRPQCHLAARERRAQFAAIAGQRRQQFGEALLLRVPRDQRQCLGKQRSAAAACGGDDALGGLGQRLGRAALLDDREFGRHPGFERETAQQ